MVSIATCTVYTRTQNSLIFTLIKCFTELEMRKSNMQKSIFEIPKWKLAQENITGKTASYSSLYGRWFFLAWIPFTDSITDTTSRTWLSDNPALEMCFPNLVQARLFPTEAIICLGQWVGTSWHQSEWLLLLGYLKRKHLNTISTVVAYLLSLLSQIY